MLKRKYAIPSIIILAVLFAVIVGVFLKPVQVNKAIVDITAGQSARSIANTLYKQKVIDSPLAFYLLVRLTGNDKKLKQGAYLFDGTMNLIQAMQKIISGEILVQKVTIPEGTSLYKTLRILAENNIGNYDKFLQLSENKEFILNATGFEISSLEGFIYPDTYVFNFKNTEEDVLKKMVENFFHKLKNDNIDFSDKKYFYKTLKLASIIEKEAVFPEEKPLIASVYQNRLDKNMLLQADPTSTYHLEKVGVHKNKLLYSDVRKDTPHNTYVHTGLPPTPICSPSISAIQAALNPAKTGYLFFFATPERKHIFTVSYQEHLKKQKLQKQS